MNQQLKKKNLQKRFHDKPASRKPRTSNGSGEATRLPAPFLTAPPGLGLRALEELPAGSAPTEGLLGFGGCTMKSNQVIFLKVHLSSSAVLIAICMLFPGFFAAICGCRQKNSKGFLG